MNASTPTSDAEPSESQSATPQIGDLEAVKAILNGIYALSKVPSGRLTNVYVDRENNSVLGTVTSTVEIKLPDRAKMAFYFSPGTPTSESIYVGQDYYHREQGVWEKKAPPMDLVQIWTFTITKGESLEDFVKRVSDGTYVGEDSLNNEAMLVYQIRYTGDNGKSFPVRFWISKTTGIVCEYQAIDIPSTATVRTSITEYYYDFNTPIDIQPPPVP